ncbi:OmpA/MotB family protein [Georgenia muralis]
MSALLLIFILAVAVLVLQLTEREQALASEQETAEEQRARFSDQIVTLSRAEEIRAEMLLEVQENLRAQGIEVTVSENNTVLSIPAQVLGFDPASFEIKPEYRDVSQRIGTAIADVIAEDDRYRYLDTVFVEGHTDNLAFGGLEGTGNWGLSTFRAISLWRLWDEQLPADKQLDSFLSDAGKPLFSVSGYGETRPLVAEQGTDAQMAQNRRIDIRFTVVRPSADELTEILELLPEDS